MSDSVWPHRQQPTRLPVPGILQARTLEWVAIPFSNVWKWKVKVKSLSRVQLVVTPWTAAYQAPLSMGFSRQEYWSGVPLPSLEKSPYQHKNKKLPAKWLLLLTYFWMSSKMYILNALNLVHCYPPKIIHHDLPFLLPFMLNIWRSHPIHAYFENDTEHTLLFLKPLSSWSSYVKPEKYLEPKVEGMISP